ncbi:MAG: VOC family protein [Synechococcaceae cyanobacterium]
MNRVNDLAMAPAADPAIPAAGAPAAGAPATAAPATAASAATSSAASAAAGVHRLGHVALRVADMERAKAFYRGLGLEVTWDAPDWSYLQSPLTGDGVALLSPDYKAAGPHAAFHVDDRDALAAIHSQLARGSHPVGPIHDHRDGTASFYLQDSEGNWLEILYEPPGGIPSNVGAAAIPAPGPALG